MMPLHGVDERRIGGNTRQRRPCRIGVARPKTARDERVVREAHRAHVRAHTAAARKGPVTSIAARMLR